MSTQAKKFEVILADPPWSHQQRGGSGRGAERHYKLLDFEQIRDMPVADLAADNAHLYLWCTNASLKDAYAVMEAWGFTNRSICCWMKMRLGLGMYFRNCSEHLLFGTRGKAPVLCNSQPNIITGPVLKHSEKPLEQYTIIERMSPGKNRLELFARHRQPGWKIWGLEAPGGSDIDIPGYPVPNSPATRKQNNKTERKSNV
ncbi:MAG: MT-A70 family methyltransferase [Oscillospiraceae bacterium]|nr:MT-A70 family methyltransferase [Oscillospiraceae bacterium]